MINRKRQRGSVDNLLGGLANLVEKLGELAEKGEQLKREGSFDVEGDGKSFKGVYGFTVRTGLGGDRDEVKVEPFGNIKRDKTTGHAVVQEVREPVIDIFDEPDHLLLVAEMPGVSVEEIKAEIADDILTLRAGQGERSYYKEIVLPADCTVALASIACNNGVIEIKLDKTPSDTEPSDSKPADSKPSDPKPSDPKED
jgi:HSP20 family protein